MSKTAQRMILVTHYYPDHGGGIERVAAALSARLAQGHGWKIVWLASDTDPSPCDLGENVRCLPARAWNGVERKLGVPWPVWSPSALMVLWREIENTSVVYLHDALYFGNAFAWLFACLRGIPVIVTQHVGTISFRSATLRAIHSMANRTLGRLVLSTADQVVFISPAVRDDFAQYCRFRVPPVYWPNGVDTDIFCESSPMPDHPAIADACCRGKRILLFVGRFVEKKGLSILHELAGSFPNDLWVFAGHGPLDPAQWGLSNVLVIRGESGAGLARYYRVADLLVLPSVGEGFPLVVQEAMACGTPAMVGEETAAGCPEARPLLIVEKVGAGDTAPCWARRLAELREQPERLRGMRAEVARFARERWSWENTAAAYAELFGSLCARREK